MLNLHKQVSQILSTPGMFEEIYPHRLFKGYSYTESLREIMCERRCSWMVEWIFSAQKHERGLLDHDIQHWSLKILPDESALLICTSDDGDILYYAQGMPPVPAQQNISLTLKSKVLRMGKRG